jgi:hypothetical protein
VDTDGTTVHCADSASSNRATGNDGHTTKLFTALDTDGTTVPRDLFQYFNICIPIW